MAKIIRRETRKRGILGQLFKWALVLFNLACAAWFFTYTNDVSGRLDHVMKAGSDAEKAGATIGYAGAAGFILFVWLVGTVVLGLATMLTRGTLVVVEERED